jgi:ribosomal-protein-alanine N-acetyltransferase
LLADYSMAAHKFSNITTERLFLRELHLDDAEEIFRLRADERVNVLIDRKTAISIDDAKEFIQKILANSANNEGIMWAITLIGDPKLIGTITYWHIEWENNKAEIGYEMLPEYHGKGLMTEALKKVIDFGFNKLGFKIIVADPKAINTPSVKLLEKLGFIKTGEIEGGYVIYELNAPV